MVREWAPEQPTEEMTVTGETWSEALVALSPSLTYCRSSCIGPVTGREEEFGHLGDGSRQLAPQLARQLSSQAGVLCEQNPEDKINGSGGKQMTTSASNAEG